MTEPTNEHREQAREIVLRILRLRSDTELAGVYAEMVDAFASALSSRDAEIREVLEGLIAARSLNGSPCWCKDWERADHSQECLATRVLWEKVSSLGLQSES